MSTKRSSSPTVDRMVAAIKKDLLSGQTAPDSYLPRERDLAAEYGVGRMTARKALQKLVAEGLLRAERGHGYRALLKSAGREPGSPLVFVSNVETDAARGYGGVGASVQSILMQTGSPILTVGVHGRSAEQVMQMIADARPWGVLIENGSRRIHQMLQRSGLPCVAVDAITDDLPMDCVLQDNHGGARVAAEYLLEKGHERIAWFGYVSQSRHSLERFTGAEAAFLGHGSRMREELVVSEPTAEAAERLLSGPDRPTAVLSMWEREAVLLAQTAKKLGLVIGRDFEIVGWTTANSYSSIMDAEFSGRDRPAMICWDHRDMARIAIGRIKLRSQEPELQAVRITVPVRLVPPGTGKK